MYLGVKEDQDVQTMDSVLCIAHSVVATVAWARDSYTPPGRQECARSTDRHGAALAMDSAFKVVYRRSDTGRLVSAIHRHNSLFTVEYKQNEWVTGYRDTPLTVFDSRESATEFARREGTCGRLQVWHCKVRGNVKPCSSLIAYVELDVYYEDKVKGPDAIESRIQSIIDFWKRERTGDGATDLFYHTHSGASVSLIECLVIPAGTYMADEVMVTEPC